MSTPSRAELAARLRNFVFGVEDSLVSTVGLLSGIAIANVPRSTIFLTGAVLIFVEAFSMSVGSFLSETSEKEFDHQGKKAGAAPLADGVVMFVSYFLSGFVPLFPYLLWETSFAFPLSVGLTFIALFALGAWGAVISRRSWITGAVRMLVIGGIAIAVGMGAGVWIGGMK